MGESVNLELLAKLVLDLQAEQKAVRGDIETLRGEMQHGFAALTQKVDAQSTTLVSMRREIRSLQATWPLSFRRSTTIAAVRR